MRVRTLLLATLIAVLPSPAAGQSLACAWTNVASNDKDGQTPSLKWMNGVYELESATYDGCTNCSGDPSNLVFHLSTIRIPSQAAFPPPSIFSGTTVKGTKLGNMIYMNDGRGTMGVTWEKPGPRLGDRMKDFLLSDKTHIWCANEDLGRTLIQASIARDLRWGPKDGLSGFLGWAFDPFGWIDDWVYYGPTKKGKDRDKSWTLPHEAFTRWGFPTAKWRVDDMGEARKYDERFRTTFDPDFAQNFTTWEFQLHGSIRQVPESYEKCAKRKFNIWKLRFECVKYRRVQTFKYVRSLGGELRLTSYLSNRIGDPGYDPPRAEFQYRVMFRGPELFVPDSVEMERIADRLAKEFCGNRMGCGSIPSTPAAGPEPPFGMRFGSDSLALIQQLCSTSGKENYRDWGLSAPPGACTSDNSLIPNRNPAPADLVRDTAERGATGRAVTETEKVSARTGRRVVNGDTVAVSSQAERYCLRTAQRDSADIVNGPFPAGVSPPPAVPVDVLFNICASEMGIPLRPGAETPVLDENRCFTYMGVSDYCIR